MEFGFVLHKCFWVCLSLCVSFLFWPVIIISSVFLFPIRFCIQHLLNIIYGNGKYTLAQGMDCTFGYDKNSGGCSITTAVLTVKGFADLEKIRQMHRDYVFDTVGANCTVDSKSYAQRFTKRFVSKFGFYAWKDTSKSFNINDHVKLVDGINVNDKTTEDGLFTILGRLLDESPKFTKIIRPQWQLLIIPNYLFEGSKDPHYVVIFRIHHAYADGASGSMYINSMFGDNSIKLAVDPLKPLPGSSSFQEIALHLKAALFGPLDWIKNFKTSIYHNSPLIIKGNYSDRKYTRWSKPIDMQFLKEIRRASGTPMTSILIAAFTGAVRKFYEKTPLDLGSEIPEEIHITSTVAVIPYKNKQLQNHFTILGLLCPLKESDRVKRLEEMGEVSKRSAYSSDLIFNFFIWRFVGYWPRVFLDFMTDVSRTPIFYSNVFGAIAPCTIFGDEVTDLGGFIPLFTCYGIGFVTYSYCDQMRFCISTDSKIFSGQKDLKSFVDDVENEIKSLGQAFGVKV